MEDVDIHALKRNGMTISEITCVDVGPEPLAPVLLRILRTEHRPGWAVTAFHGLEQPAGKLPGGAHLIVLGLDSFHLQVGLTRVAGPTHVHGKMAPNDATGGSMANFYVLPGWSPSTILMAPTGANIQLSFSAIENSR